VTYRQATPPRQLPTLRAIVSAAAFECTEVPCL
jgi:hypothetical protein